MHSFSGFESPPAFWGGARWSRQRKALKTDAESQTVNLQCTLSTSRGNQPRGHGELLLQCISLQTSGEVNRQIPYIFRSVFPRVISVPPNHAPGASTDYCGIVGRVRTECVSSDTGELHRIYRMTDAVRSWEQRKGNFISR